MYDSLAKKRDTAEKLTGERKSAFINITADVITMEKRASLLAEHGWNYAMVDVVVAGTSAVCTLRDYCSDLGLANHAHRAKHATFDRNPKHGISMQFLAKLMRLIGVSQIHTGTAVGKLTGTKKEVKLLADVLRNSLTKPSGHILLEQTHVLVREFDANAVLETIEREKVTLTNLIPTMLNLMVNYPEVGKYDYSSLRVLLSGGAPIAPEVVRKIVETFKCDYIQTYGMTETSPYLTLSLLKGHLKKLDEREQLRFKSKTGREFIGVELKVVNDRGEEVKRDEKEVGEIIVKGDIVTKGYWRLPEETAKAIKNEWLHTGDMAVIDEEGYVTIVDRKKDMILTGGENVYSPEVENVLYGRSGGGYGGGGGGGYGGGGGGGYGGGGGGGQRRW